MKDIIMFAAAACAIATGASFALAGCGCSDTNDKKSEAVKDAVALPGDVTPVSTPADATAVAAPDAVSPTGG